MKLRTKTRWLALLAVFALFAAACGADSVADEATEAVDDAADVVDEAADAVDGDDEEAMEDDEEAMEDDEEAMEDDAMEDEGGAVCEVTDTGGVDDRSFNQLAFEGAEAAEERFGWEPRVIESTSETDFDPNIASYVDQGDCNLIVTVGFALGDATASSAADNPDQQYAIVDFAYDPAIDNVQGLIFQIDQAAFLVGYIAADQTQTGVVGTFGGVNIPPVTDFMEGFAQGVAYYNGEKGTDVTVLGWDSEAQDGLFTGNFESLEDGRSFAENLADEGADIILPVAGPVGLGAAALVQERDLRLIGVDADWTQTAAEFDDVILTSILKNIDVAVLNAATAVHNDEVSPVLLSTLESGGVGFAPITNAWNEGTDLEAELETISAGIIDGSIPTKAG